MIEDPDQPRKTENEDSQLDHDEQVVNPHLVPEGFVPEGESHDGTER